MVSGFTQVVKVVLEMEVDQRPQLATQQVKVYIILHTGSGETQQIV